MTPATQTKSRSGIPYKWLVLTNTTLGVFMAMLDSSIVMISLPDIFRGIKLNPLAPANFSYLLWMLMGYGLVAAILVVTLGRIGDIFGRVQDVQPRLRRLHAGVHRAVVHLEHRAGRRHRDHRVPHDPGDRRRDAHGQLGGHPHRRVPCRGTRHGARHQP